MNKARLGMARPGVAGRGFQQIYQLRLTGKEADLLLSVLFPKRANPGIGRIYRRLEKIMDQIGGDET
jgi:hypothetical protein